MWKKIIFLFFTVVAGHSFSQTTYTWVSTGSNLANNGSNWLPNAVPGQNDNVVFDGTSSIDCNWSLSSVNSMSLLSGYSGNINFITSNVLLTGNLVINSGTVHTNIGDLEFLSTASSLFIQSGSGFYDGSTGKVIIEVDQGETFTFAGAIVINTLVIVGKGVLLNQRDINFGANLTVDVLIMAVGQKVHSYQGTVHVKQILDVGGNPNATAYITVPTNNTGTFIFDGNHAIIKGVSNSTKGALPNIVINTSGTYTLDNKINVYGDWAGMQGTLTVGTSEVNFFATIAQITGTAAAFDDLDIQNGSVVNMPSNAEVKVSGNLTRSGTLIFQTTTALGLNGTGNQNISTPGFTLASIIAYGSGSSRNVDINAPIGILDSLKVGANVTFKSGLGANISLKSSSALTARVAKIGPGGSITGNIVVETTISGGKTGWAQLGVRGVMGQKVADWDTYASSGGATGIPMACVGCSYGPNSMPTWFKSILGWDETDSYGYDTNFVVLTSLNPGTGYWVYVGDGQVTTSDLKLVNTGNLNTGTITIPVTSGGPQTGYNLVANPYPSPISWDAVMANPGNSTTVTGAIYAWNANTAAYTTYIGGVASPGAPNGIDNIIAAGQGFYVVATSSGNLVFVESNKTSGNTFANPLIRSAPSSSIGQIFRVRLEGVNSSDVTTFRIHDDATETFDNRFDAKKLFESPGYMGYPGPYSKYTTISSKDASGIDYAIQSLPPLTTNSTIPLLVRVSISGSYTITAKDFKDFYSCVVLFDKVTNAYHDLRISPYVFVINDTTSSARFELVLCKDGSTTDVGISENDNSGSIFISRETNGLFVKTIFDKNTKCTVSVYDVIGQKVMEDLTIEGTMTSTELPIDLHNQLLIIKIITDQGFVIKKVAYY